MNTRTNVYEEKHKVIAYARISTQEDEQQNSLQNQKEYFEKVINENPNWELVDIVYDMASGTSIKGRDGFKMLLERAKNQEYTLLVTKEQSRFSRNVLQTLIYIQELHENNVECFFLLDNIYTGDPDAMMRLQLMATIYESEVKRISERVKFGHRENFQNGKVYGAYVYGYDLNEGTLTVNDETSKVVKMIYDLFLDGLGYRAIKNKLEELKIPSPLGKDTWVVSTIKNILKSEKYKGCLCQQKWITESNLTKKRKRNKDATKFVYLEDTHDAIVTKEVWDRVQAEMENRANIYKHKTNNRKGRYSAKYPYSSKLICGKCGDTFKRKIWNKHKDGTYTHCWGCSNRFDNGVSACDNKMIPEYILDAIMGKIIDSLKQNKDEVLMALDMALNESIKDKDYTKQINDLELEIKKIKNRDDSLLDLMLDGTITKEAYKDKKQKIDNDLKVKEELLKSYLNIDKSISDSKEKIKKIFNVINGNLDLNNTDIFNDTVREILSKIVIHDRENYEVYLNVETSFKVKYSNENSHVLLLPFDSDSMYRQQQRMVDKIELFETHYDLSNQVIPTVSADKLKYDQVNVKLFIAM